MFVIELNFECFRDTQISLVERSINLFLEALRDNGQILGREFPISIHQGWFLVRLTCPEKDSLDSAYHSPQVKLALAELTEAGLLSPKLKIVGQDINSHSTDTCKQISWQFLFTTYVHTCSPLRCGEHFSPIPLYKIPAVANGTQRQIIKWQEDWEACDQLQMNGSVLEHGALTELADVESRLARRGMDLSKRIQHLTKVPTYYYLYRVGGETKKSEHNRVCPGCRASWRLAEPLFDILDFKCDSCRLVSNISWDFKD